MSSPLELGLQVVHRAVELDQQQNYVEAVRHYDIAINYFQEAIRSEPAPDRRALFESKVREYADRAHALRSLVPAPSPALPASSIYVQPPANYGVPATAPAPAPTPAPSPAGFAGGPLLSSSSSSSSFSAPLPGAAAASFHQPPPAASFSAAPVGVGSPAVPAHSTAAARSPSDPNSIICHPLIAEYAVRFPRHVPNLQAALDLAEAAKNEDKANHMQAALDLYNEVLERFVLCLNSETNGRIRESLRETINSYMLRAEKIKEVFKITPNPFPSSFAAPLAPQPPVIHSLGPSFAGSSATLPLPSPVVVAASAPPSLLPSSSSSSSSHFVVQPASAQSPGSPAEFSTTKARSAVKPGPGIAITVSNTTKTIFARKSLHFTACLVNSQLVAGSKAVIKVEVINESTLVVEYIKVTLRSNTRKATTDAKGRNVMESSKETVRKEEFYQGSIFPLQAESNYKGDLIFQIPPGLPPTNLQHLGFFERDYELKIECVLPLRKNLAVYIPLVIE